MIEREVVNLGFIRETRIKQGKSIEEMAVSLGYEGYQAYYYKERGIRKMSAEDIAKISYVLDVPMEKLFFKEIVTEKVTEDKKRVAI